MEKEGYECGKPTLFLVTETPVNMKPWASIACPDLMTNHRVVVLQNLRHRTRTESLQYNSCRGGYIFPPHMITHAIIGYPLIIPVEEIKNYRSRGPHIPPEVFGR